MRHSQQRARYNCIKQHVDVVRFSVESDHTTTIKKPHIDTRLAKFVEKRVLELRPSKSQIEIASEAGFVKRRS